MSPRPAEYPPPFSVAEAIAEPFPDLGRVLEQLAETDRTREPSRARADDEDTDLDALVGRVARRRDVVRRPKRRWDV